MQIMKIPSTKLQANDKLQAPKCKQMTNCKSQTNPPAIASSPASQARRGGLGHERAGINDRNSTFKTAKNNGRISNKCLIQFDL